MLISSGLPSDTAIALTEAPQRGATHPSEQATPLHEQEEQLLQTLPVRRRADFAAGRLAAACAMRALGVAGPVLRDGRRPRFPMGVRGSLSHCVGHIGVCMASTNPHVLATGVDLERTDRIGRGAAGLICTPREREWALRDGQWQSKLSLLFSAKEAVYKAMSGLCTRRPVFHDVELTVWPGRLADRLHIEVTDGLLPAPHRLAGWAHRMSDRHVLTYVVVSTPAAVTTPSGRPLTTPSGNPSRNTSFDVV